MTKEVEINPVLTLWVGFEIEDNEICDLEILDIVKGNINDLYHAMAENRDLDKELEEKLLIN